MNEKRDKQGEVLFDADLIRRYGGRGPRYTSYPTALQFDDGLQLADYMANASATNAVGTPLSIYTHIPFCSSLCYYCGCNKVVTRSEARVERYMRYLDREIAMQANLFDRSRPVEQLHLGGGTPTYLDPRQLAALMASLDDAFGLTLDGQQEFSIEVDPRTVDVERIRELTALGFNRLSLGIQDFEPRVQKAVNRIQSASDVMALVEESRSAGFRSVSLDLIYGLPHQTVASFARTIDRIVELTPDRLAVYNYAHLPERFKGQRMIDAETLPSDAEKLEILHLTIDRLTCAGYEYIGMDHFALPDDALVQAQRDGTLQRNFQGYSTHRHCDLVGLGASSIGSIGNMLAQNAVTTLQYESILEAGDLPVVRGYVLDADDRLRRDVIQSLMCFDSLEFRTIERKHGITFTQYFADELGRLAPLVEDGLVRFDDTAIHVTPTGRLLLRSIAMVFDRYLSATADERRYSKVI